MRGWASYLSLLGGRGALTPAGIVLVVSIAFVLTLLSGWGPYAEPDHNGHFLPNLLGHVAVGVLALLLWWLLFFLPAQSPPAAMTLAVFVLLGVVRIYAIDLAYRVVGLPALGASSSRFALSIALTVALFSLIGVLTELIQRSRRARRRLEQAQKSIKLFGALDQSARTLSVTEVMARAQAHVDSLLVPWRVSPPRRPAVVARELEALVEEVIRPLSHDAKFSVGPVATSASPPEEPEAGERRSELVDDPDALFPKDLRWREILPTRGVSLLVVIAPIVVLFMWERFGWGTESLVAASTLPLLAGALWLLRRLVLRFHPRTAIARFVWMIAGMALAGVGATALHVVAARGIGSSVDFVFAAPVLMSLFGTGFSVAEHLLSVTLRRERIRSQSLSVLALRTARQQGGTRVGRTKAADRLHSGVQAELVAWAAFFRSPEFRPGDLPSALEQMRHRVDALFNDPPGHDDTPARSRFDALISVWSAARPVDATVEHAVWAVLDQHRALADDLFLVLSEAFSNAVRHGRSGDIAVNIAQRSPETLQLSVSNPGSLDRIGGSGTAGVGLLTIDEHSRERRLDQHGGRVVLTVSFSISAVAAKSKDSTDGHSPGPAGNRGGDDGNRTRTISLED